MDFTWPIGHIELAKKVFDFASNHLNDGMVERDSEGIFCRKMWKTCAGFGIQGLAAPKDNGGNDNVVDITKGVMAMEAFGKGCKDNGLALALNAQMWTVQVPLIEFGSSDQCKKYLTSMVSGDMIGAHALTEPNAGSDVFSMQTTAIKKDNGYLLNGQKHLITLAPVADFFLVFAFTNPEMKRWGMSAFLVDKNTPGLYVGETQSKMGMRTVPIGRLEFKDCFIPNENRLGSEGAGFSIITHSLEYDRCCILASQLGAMQRQLDTTLAYCKERNQFGKSIKEFQSVSNRLADMRLRIETSRLLLYKVAWLKQQKKPAMMEAAMLKLHLSENFIASSMDAVRCAGGIGYLSEYGVERDLRDSIGGVIYAGTSDIQRNIIAQLMESS